MRGNGGRINFRPAYYLFILVITLLPARVLKAQECPNSGSCNAIVGSLVLPATAPSTAPNRVVHGEQPSPDKLFTDEVIGLSYNRSWSSSAGLGRDFLSEPSTWLGFESYWNGNMELNIDIAPANSNSYVRPFGFNAAYNGSIAGLLIGGSPYGQGGAGVELSGGTGSIGSLVSIQDQNGRQAPANMLEMSRQDGSDSFAWRAGGIPRLVFALQTNMNANWAGNYGVMKFAGEWDHGEPLLEFEDTGVGAMLINSIPATTDTSPRFTIFANGNMNWGSGARAVDTDLYRNAPGTLRTDGALVVGGNLMVMGSKAALVQTASYGKREVYAVESPGEWFEDFGSGKLTHGSARIRIDPVFGETVTTEHDYHVFVTPNGRCSLYVEHKAVDGFVVRSLRGTKTCGFDYRIVARRKGYEAVRLARVRDQN